MFLEKKFNFRCYVMGCIMELWFQVIVFGIPASMGASILWAVTKKVLTKGTDDDIVTV